MGYEQIIGKVKEIIYNSYPSVFNFDIEKITNGGNELKVYVAFKTSISQPVPKYVKFIFNRNNINEYKMITIYPTRAAKIFALIERAVGGLVNSYQEKGKNDVDEFINANIDSFIQENQEIIDSEGTVLEKPELIDFLKRAIERMVKF